MQEKLQGSSMFSPVCMICTGKNMCESSWVYSKIPVNQANNQETRLTVPSVDHSDLSLHQETGWPFHQSTILICPSGSSCLGVKREVSHCLMQKVIKRSPTFESGQNDCMAPNWIGWKNWPNDCHRDHSVTLRCHSPCSPWNGRTCWSPLTSCASVEICGPGRGLTMMVAQGFVKWLLQWQSLQWQFFAPYLGMIPRILII